MVETTASPVPKSVGALAAAIAGSVVAGDPSVPVSGMQYDSRRVRAGDLFAALRGGYMDGHAFAEDAVARGAVALLVEEQLALNVPQLVVNNSRKELASVAATFFEHPSDRLTVVGITGTDGKTTTTYLTETILSAAGKRNGVMGTIAVRVGDLSLDVDARQTTPESLDIQRYLFVMAELGVEVALVEATSHGLALHRLDETRIGVAAVTNITHEHLELHGTVEAYRGAKAILFKRCAESGGTAVINLDDPGAEEMMRHTAGASRTITYGLERSEADIRADRISVSATGTTFWVVTGKERIQASLPLLGDFNVANALCAAAVAQTHDISLSDSFHALARSRQIPGRLARIDLGQPFSVVVDYAHTPESVGKVLGLLRSITPKGRLILVMGSAGERDTAKRPLQGAVAGQLADYAVFTTEDPRYENAERIITDIADGALAVGAAEGSDFVRITDRAEAIHHAITSARPGDCVLLAGKGHEQSIIWGSEKRPWDEAASAREALSRCGYTG